MNETQSLRPVNIQSSQKTISQFSRGKITGLFIEGKPVIEVNSHHYKSETMVSVTSGHSGKEVVLGLLDDSWLILGFLVSDDQTTDPTPETIQMFAKEGVELGSGKSRLRLHPDGKITLNGQDLNITMEHKYQVKSKEIHLN